MSLAYICIYLPWFVVHVHIGLGGGTTDPVDPVLNKYVNKYFTQPVRILPFAGSAVNPVIYAFVDPKFRSQCRALFK